MKIEDFTTAAGTVFPVVHLNGSGRDRLIGQRLAALDALQRFTKCLRAMSPNGRDYYPVESLRNKAIETHRKRLRCLTEMHNEIDAELAGIMDQPS